MGSDGGEVGTTVGGKGEETTVKSQGDNMSAYLIFVIFFTRAKFFENKIYTEVYTVNCQFFALNL